uniref:Retrovirus-related Pol polyprotein from transposon TNT 1-94-like beta-barrel domain-containing protein n=1 Tax=Strigamia maritima TaxID=126957 RepID=T1IQZ4_STRMM
MRLFREKIRHVVVLGRGRDKAEAYYLKQVKDISNVVACTTVINNLTWYLDCACSDHDAPLELGDGYSTVQGIGDIKLYTYVDRTDNQITLKNVLYVSKFRRNLMSVAKMDVASFHFHIFNGTLTVYRSAYNDPLFRGKLLVNDGLYELTSRTVPTCTDNVHSQVIPSHKLEKLGGVVESNNFPSCNISVSAWHRCYAHMYVRGLKQLAQNDDVKGIKFSSPVKDITCDVCNISKSTRASIWDPSTDKVHETKHVKIVKSKRWINFDDERDDDENGKNPNLISNNDSNFDDDVFEAEAQSDED